MRVAGGIGAARRADRMPARSSPRPVASRTVPGLSDGERGPFAAADVQALQRSAGNTSVAGLLVARRPSRGAARSRPLLQRLGVAAGSDPALTGVYNALVLTPTFAQLNQAVTRNTNIALVDSSIPGAALGPVDYTSLTHTIRVPVNQNGVARPLADVREDVMWEMHNARNRGALGRVAIPGAAVTSEEKRTYAERMAAAALAIEWAEWIRVAEQATRAARINATLGAGHITNAFAAFFAVADQGWFVFKNYMAAQLAGGHTARYDPAAAPPANNWAGTALVQRYASSASLKITGREVTKWLSGERMYIKSEANNPFRSHRPA
jgi:hypothetical protein